MQDRFKFRAKRIDNNKFIEGYLCFIYIDNQKKAKIYCPDDCCNYDVYTETIRQCTGLKDRNGKRIYEGDILQSEEYPFKNEKGYNYAAEVLWDDASATFYYYTFRISNNVAGRSTGNTGELNEYEDWKVIGNIYENPELLTGAEN